MSKKNRYLVIIALILAVVVAAIALSGKKSNEPDFADPLLKDRNFAYEDINALTSIVINRKKYPSLVFKKLNQNSWQLNSKYMVNEATMPHLLAALKGVKMKYIPPQTMLQTIKDDIKSDGIEVKLYAGDELVKHYHIGTEFGDGSDTPFLMEGSSQPFMMYLPGLDGSVRRRFIYDMDEWKSKTIFSEDPELIKKISVNYPQDKASSFSLFHQTDDFRIVDHNGKTPDRKFNTNTISAYFNFFTDISGESNESENPERNNILSGQPFCVITLVMNDNSVKEYVLYSMSNLVGDLVITGPRNIHPDNKYFVLMPDGQLLLTQQRVIGKILRPYWYFF